MADLTLKLDYDISSAEMKQKKLDEEWEKQKRTVNENAEEVKELEELLQRQQDELHKATTEWSKQKNLVAEIQSRLAATDSPYEFTTTNAELTEARAKLSDLAQKQEQIGADADKTQKALNKANSQYERASSKLRDMAIKQKQIAERTAQTTASQKEMPSALNSAGKSLDKFTTRIKGLIKRVFIFSLITMALRKLRKAIADMIGQDSELSKYVAQIKGNLSVMGRTLFEALRPAITWLIQSLAYLTQLLTTILAKVLNKNVKQMADMAKSSAKTAKNAERTTAAFDTLQKIDTSSKDDESGTGADYSQFDGEKWTEEQLAKIMAVAGTALLAIGLILTFTGANIPLGLAAMAAGVALIVTAARMSNTMEGKTKAFVTKVMAIAGGALLVLGIILCVTGVALPLGIAAIVAGLGLLVGAVALNWDSLKQKIEDNKGKIMAVVSTMALIIGILLVITGVAAPLGLGLIATAATIWNATPQEDKEWLIDKLQKAKEAIINAWNWLKDFVKEKIGKLKDDLSAFWELFKENPKQAFRTLLNGAIQALNWLIEKANKLIEGINKLGGALNFSLPYIPYIPYSVPKLAKGAVIPGGSPFLAMLGDQPRGQTNIETPLETMIEAFKAAQRETNVNIEFTGSLAQLARVLNPQIRKEQKRASIW